MAKAPLIGESRQEGLISITDLLFDLLPRLSIGARIDGTVVPQRIGVGSAACAALSGTREMRWESSYCRVLGKEPGALFSDRYLARHTRARWLAF
jgi:hypothetical protein